MANKAISTLAVGSSVYLNVGGVRTEFLVVHQGLPSNMYDASCDGTWLLMKDIYEKRAGNTYNSNDYGASSIKAYLNNAFLNLFDSDIRELIKQVKIPYVDGTGGAAVKSGANGLSSKVFLLSGYEAGWSDGDPSSIPADGACLSYFGKIDEFDRAANFNGESIRWWLRSPYAGNSSSMWQIGTDGAYVYAISSSSYGIRPCIILPSDAIVDDSGNVTLPVDLTAHKTLVNGTAYTVQGGKCMVGGTVYNILKGRALIDGTGWDITLPSAGTALSALDVGQSVFANVGGVRTEFLVVHQGLPSNMYDASCDGTWLLMKDCYASRAWSSANTNDYENSNINTYLNGTFLSLFDADIKGLIKQVKIPYLKGGTGGTIQSGANGLACKVFLLGGYEVGWTTDDSKSFPVDGAKLDYFGASSNGDSKRIANLNGSATRYALRSPYVANASYVWLVVPSGDYGSGSASNSRGIRPCIILPSDALVNNEFELIA